MIDIFARYIEGEFVFEPMKRRGMSKGEYLRAVAACQRLNADGIQHSSSVVAFLPPDNSLPIGGGGAMPIAISSGLTKISLFLELPNLVFA